MPEPDYLEVSRQFARQLEGREGVVSVGLGKEDGEFVLVVAVDGPRAPEVDATQGSPVRPGLPRRFHGLRVVVQDLGEARLFTA